MTEKRQQWTPGPWTFHRTHRASADAWFVIVDPKGRGPIVDVGGDEMFGQIAEAKYLITDPTIIEANARLIAAAPEMYQALHESVKAMQHDCCSINCPCCGDLRSAIAQAEAALLAAEGGQP